MFSALIFYNEICDGKFQLNLLKFVLKYWETIDIQIMGLGVMRSRWPVREEPAAE